MIRLYKSIASCGDNFVNRIIQKFIFPFLDMFQESFLGGMNAEYALIPVKSQSPRKPAAVYRSNL